MSEPKKLIEVAMPIKEISAESVRDKSIRHGHISTLHLWWARRPLPVCRGVIFASLVPDPLDENCPNQFKEALEILIPNSRLWENGLYYLSNLNYKKRPLVTFLIIEYDKCECSFGVCFDNKISKNPSLWSPLKVLENRSINLSYSLVSNC